MSKSSNMLNRFVLCMPAFQFQTYMSKLYTGLRWLFVIELLFLKASVILRKNNFHDDCCICYNNIFFLPVATHGHDASNANTTVYSQVFADFPMLSYMNWDLFLATALILKISTGKIFLQQRSILHMLATYEWVGSGRHRSGSGRSFWLMNHDNHCACTLDWALATDIVQ
jgi:hypothetical protein